MSQSIKIDEIKAVARDRRGYWFGVGLVEGRWAGFAWGLEGEPPRPSMLFLLPEVSEGFRVGLADRATAVALTAAVALDPESAYGGVDEWFIPEAERPAPGAFRCPHCLNLHADGDCDSDGPQAYLDVDDEFMGGTDDA